MEGEHFEKPLRVFLWMVPRTNSTAFLKCLSFVDDTEVWLEPYLSCFMNGTINNPHWGKGIPNVKQLRTDLEEFTKNEEYVALKQLEEKKEKECDNIWQPNVFNYPWLKQQLEIDPRGKKFIFIKEESFAIKGRLEFLPDVPTRHAFLIRHPQEVFPSFKNMVVNGMNFVKVPDWNDVHLGDGAPYMPIKDLFQIHHNNWKYVTENLDPNPTIIDGFDLISKPEVILPKLFEKLGIPYKESYLHWEEDPELVYSSWKGSSEFVVFESQNVITSRAVQSTRFEPPKYARGTSRPEWKLTDELKVYIEAAMPYYKKCMQTDLLNTCDWFQKVRIFKAAK